MQRSAIEQATAGRGEDVAEWYDEKRSAKTMARPELARLRKDVRAGKIQKLYVWRLDRLARTGIRDTLVIVEELRLHGCSLVSLSDGFDLEGPASEVVLAVLAWAAKMEHVAIVERIALAREKARAEGRRWGRPPRMTDAEAAHARSLKKSQGHSLRSLSSVLGVPRPTLARALKRPSRKSRLRPLAKTRKK